MTDALFDAANTRPTSQRTLRTCGAAQRQDGQIRGRKTSPPFIWEA